MKTMKTLKTLKDKREGLPEEEERDGSRPDVENKVKAKRTIPTEQPTRTCTHARPLSCGGEMWLDCVVWRSHPVMLVC